jgi:tetratricopeptide (TPR) repeat protein
LARAYANRAAILLEMGRPDEALAGLERAANLDPDEIGLQRSLSLLRAQLRADGPPD